MRHQRQHLSIGRSGAARSSIFICLGAQPGFGTFQVSSLGCLATWPSCEAIAWLDRAGRSDYTACALCHHMFSLCPLFGREAVAGSPGSSQVESWQAESTNSHSAGGAWQQLSIRQASTYQRSTERRCPGPWILQLKVRRAPLFTSEIESGN